MRDLSHTLPLSLFLSPPLSFSRSLILSHSLCLQAAWLRDNPMISIFCSRAATHAQQIAYLPKPVSHSAIYNHLPLSLPFFSIIFISCKSALIWILSSRPLYRSSKGCCLGAWGMAGECGRVGKRHGRPRQMN